MTRSVTRSIEQAAMAFFFALATLPIIGFPLLAVAAHGVIQ